MLRACIGSSHARLRAPVRPSGGARTGFSAPRCERHTCRPCSLRTFSSFSPDILPLSCSHVARPPCTRTLSPSVKATGAPTVRIWGRREFRLSARDRGLRVPMSGRCLNKATRRRAPIHRAAVAGAASNAFGRCPAWRTSYRLARHEPTRRCTSRDAASSCH